MTQQIVPYNPLFFQKNQLEAAETYTKNLFLTVYQKLPPSESSTSNALQTLADAYEVGRKIYDHPSHFTYELIFQVTEDIRKQAEQKVHLTVQNFFKPSYTSLSSLGAQCFTKAEQAISLFSSLLEQTKKDLKRMFVDLFNAFIVPISLEACKIPISLNFLNASAMTGAALMTHKLATEHLKEEPKQAKSITCGAIMGLWISFVVDESLLIGMLSGAVVALITDTALLTLSQSALTKFLKKQYIEWKIEKKAAMVYKCAKKIFPYIFYTLGTAFVYAKLRPLTDRLLKDDPPSSEQIYTAQLVLTSAMLFAMGTSYLKTITKSLLKPIIVSLSSAEQTRRIIFWAPRVLAILSITYIASSKLKN